MIWALEQKQNLHGAEMAWDETQNSTGLLISIKLHARLDDYTSTQASMRLKFSAKLKQKIPQKRTLSRNSFQRIKWILFEYICGWISFRVDLSVRHNCDPQHQVYTHWILSPVRHTNVVCFPRTRYSENTFRCIVQSIRMNNITGNFHSKNLHKMVPTKRLYLIWLLWLVQQIGSYTPILRVAQ